MNKTFIAIHEDVPADRLKVGGMARFTTIDYPGKVSAVLFLKGCPWDCLYCQNPDLRHREHREGDEGVSWEYIEHFLNRRKGLLDGVVFSGGEPCLDPALPAAVKLVKEMGYSVGLHTGGAYPERLKEIIHNLDWVGLDVKAPLNDEAYERVVRRPKAAEKAKESLETVLSSGKSYEVRCTAHPDYLSDKDLEEVARELKELGVHTFALQIYRQPPGVKESELLERVGSNYPSEEVLDLMRAFFPEFILRRN